MSSHLKAELAATCSTLGRLHKGEYLIEPECVESVKDLIRYLKRDDESHEIRRYLGESKVLQNDLVHIIKCCPEENSDLFDVTLRLLINLTTPTLIFYRDELPTEKIGRNIYLNLIGHAQCYKVAFSDVQFWSKMCGKLTNLFETDWSERSADDGIQIERILLLLRNILQIPADEENEKRPENDITVHDKVLWALRQSQILELLLFLSSNKNEEQYFLNLLEIFSLVLREQNGKVLAQCDVHRSGIEKAKDAEDLVKAREFEKHSRNKYKNVRKFSATFVLKGIRSFSNKDVVCHNVPDKVDILKPNGLNKKQVRSKKNRIPIESERPERRSTFSIRLFLKEFCVEFLSSAFSGLMNIVKNKLDSGKSLPNDQSYYFWALKFFLEFAVSLNSDVTLIQDVISVETFHFVQMSMDDAFDHLLADKKKNTDWVKRIHLILKAYHNLLQTLLWMDCSKNALARSVSREIKSQIFCVAEYREMTLHIFLRYDPTKFSMSYLRDVIETAHLFIKLLEEHSRQTKLVIQKLVKKKPKATKDKHILVKESREEKWEKIKDDVCDILCSENQFPEIPPFDAALEIPIDDQKDRAMKNIQKLLHCGKIREGIGLLRSSRQVWPENDFFGSKEISIEDETLALKEICIANLCVTTCGSPPEVHEGERGESWVEKKSEEEDSQNQAHIVEKDFDMLEYKKRLINRKIIQGCVTLLKNYKKNSDHTNHCIIKLLYRVGWECCMPAMLYQASLFWTLLNILQDKSKKYNEINTFTTNLLRKFRKHASQHPVVFLDLLFWKDYKVALEIQHRYESYSDEKKTSKLRRTSGEMDGKKKKKGRGNKQISKENNEKQSRNTEKKKTRNQKVYINLSCSDESDVLDISENENESPVNLKSRNLGIFSNENSDSVDEQILLNEKATFRGFDGNTYEEIRNKAWKTPNKSLKKQKHRVNKYKVCDDGEKADTQNLKGRKSKKLIDIPIEISLKREFSRRFGQENEGADTFAVEQIRVAFSKNSPIHTTHSNDHQKTKKESKSELETSSVANVSGNNQTLVETSNATPKKLVSKPNSKEDTEFLGENFKKRNYSKPKRVRYISSDSDNYQSEDEGLIPVETKRWKKSVMIDSDSD